MDNAGFDAARWDHWLLVFCFLGVAGSGLRLSWQWRRAAIQRRRLARSLAVSSTISSAISQAESWAKAQAKDQAKAKDASKVGMSRDLDY